MNEPLFPQFGALAALDHLLDLLPGQWAGRQRAWLKPGLDAAESPAAGSFWLLPGAHTLLYKFESSLQERSFQGLALFSYNTLDGRMQGSWSDSLLMSHAMLVSQGQVYSGGFSLLGSYAGPAGGPPWGWRTELQAVDRRSIVLRAFNVAPQGAEALVLETTYSR